jgi:hypothetical protein
MLIFTIIVCCRSQRGGIKNRSDKSRNDRRVSIRDSKAQMKNKTFALKSCLRAFLESLSAHRQSISTEVCWQIQRRRGNGLLLLPQERSRMLVEDGCELEDIAKIIIETERGRQDRSESMAKEQRWDKIRSILSLKPSSSSDLKHRAGVKSCYSSRTMKKSVSQWPRKGLLFKLRKLKRNRSDKLRKGITLPQADSSTSGLIYNY